MALKREEFKYNHCGRLELDEGFFEMAQKARASSNTPYIINSGYRCPEHNKEVGSTSENHVKGKAMDILVPSGQERVKILKGLFIAGFRRIGIGKDFIHADVMDAVESCWLRHEEE